MAALMRNHSWPSSGMKAPSHWTNEFKLLTNLVLSCPQPMMLWWGHNLVQVYNDAIAPLMGPERHPQALGRPAKETWHEVWDVFGPHVESVLRGEEPIWNEEQQIQFTRHGMRRQVWWSYGFTPIRTDSEIKGVVFTCQEVTGRHRLTHRIRQQSERLQQLFEQAPGFVAILVGEDHVFQLANAAYRELVGNRPLIGKPIAKVLPEAAAQGFLDRLDAVYRSGKMDRGSRVPLHLTNNTKTSKKYLLDFIYQPIVEDDGHVSGIFIQGHDVTAHASAEKNLTLINHELKHRVKNTLAVITGIVNQTLRKSGYDEILRALRERISAYARAHDILAPQTWATGTVQGAVSSALQPFQARGSFFSIEGPDLTLGSRQVLSLALAVHELAANAARFGALTLPTGRVDIRWGLVDPGANPKFEFSWEESGGPPVSTPGRQGFGLHLVSRVLAGDFDATTTIAFPPQGMTFKMLALAPSLRPADPDSFFVVSGESVTGKP